MNQYKQDQGLTQEQQVAVDVMAAALVRSLTDQASKQQIVPQQEDEKEIDLVALFVHLLGKIHLIVLAALIGALAVGYWASRSVPLYSATSKLYVVGNQGATLNVSSLQLGNMLTMDYEEVFHTWEVHEMVRTELNLDYSYTEMQDMISISNPDSTRVLYVTAEHTDPVMARNLANAYANAAKKFILQTMDSEEPNIFSVALEPTDAAVLSKTRYALLGFLAGALLVIGVLTLIFILDERPQTPENLEAVTGVPTLAVLPRVQDEPKKKLGRKNL